MGGKPGLLDGLLPGLQDARDEERTGLGSLKKMPCILRAWGARKALDTAELYGERSCFRDGAHSKCRLWSGRAPHFVSIELYGLNDSPGHF